MKLNGKDFKTICFDESSESILIIDQIKLPHELVLKKINTLEGIYNSIKNMEVRGAPLIGVAGAYGLVFGIKNDASLNGISRALDYLNSSRPTAVNLEWSLNRIFQRIKNIDENKRYTIALSEAKKIEDEDIQMCSSIGDHGLNLIKDMVDLKYKDKSINTFNILTHCNAGWLATVDWGTALSPIYKAHRAGVQLHVWVDETRPRNQGSNLTSFELKGEGVPHTVIVDNAGGYLMQNGQVDLVLVGSDRVTSSGDVCNKIGTYLKALAAFDSNIPFYAALPSSTIDWNISDGLNEIPIETRSQDEIKYINGLTSSGQIETIRLTYEECNCLNPAFDVTPAKYVTGLITERGICNATKASLKQLFSLQNQ